MLATLFNIVCYLLARYRQVVRKRRRYHQQLPATNGAIDTKPLLNRLRVGSEEHQDEEDIVSKEYSINNSSMSELFQDRDTESLPLSPKSSPKCTMSLSPQRLSGVTPQQGYHHHHKMDNDEVTKPMINHLVFCLSIADFIACSAIVFSQLCMLLKVEFVHQFNFCVYIRCIIHFGFLSSFLWTNCIAYHLLRETYGGDRPYRVPLIVFHLIGWGVSLGSVAVFLFGHFITRNEVTGWCSINDTYQFYFWVLPLAGSLLWNMLCYVLIYVKFRKVLSFNKFGQQSHQLQRHIAKKLSLYMAAFILSWIWDIINHTVFYAVKQCPPFWMWVLQDLFSPLQGFFNFIVYSFANLKQL
ncbi:hypothetical protein SAMD00019534_059360 [Acytostelium subglobosum LB1]|uniref:hypothetical protein n=1 Tax=Acytostelium subglobosum LB1 TaxID=1410327 RepID=UPI000644D4D3|nr:hypothetical protein SAMD00019534_059360 [Acytostelium subglobosum LB1]GAM22761.1 hypothetical protein SAMD00019534_059360 [Acytostelium subglobosum LB1]|eukprot:XP_012753988.1 hypothetical protein SAMD00019534_059360 [Acytostelium subglobosum LB1]